MSTFTVFFVVLPASLTSTLDDLLNPKSPCNWTKSLRNRVRRPVTSSVLSPARSCSGLFVSAMSVDQLMGVPAAIPSLAVLDVTLKSSTRMTNSSGRPTISIRPALAAMPVHFRLSVGGFSGVGSVTVAIAILSAALSTEKPVAFAVSMSFVVESKTPPVPTNRLTSCN